MDSNPRLNPHRQLFVIGKDTAWKKATAKDIQPKPGWISPPEHEQAEGFGPEGEHDSEEVGGLMDRILSNGTKKGGSKWKDNAIAELRAKIGDGSAEPTKHVSKAFNLG